MKKKLFGVWCSLVLIAGTFTACDDDDGYSLDKYWVGMATVEAPGATEAFPVGGTTPFWFTLDNGATLWPAAFNPYLSGVTLQNQHRVVADFTLLSGEKDGYSHYIRLNDLRKVLTKNIDTVTVQTPDTSVLRGKDPVDMEEVWIGDGFINIEFDYFGSPGHPHYINLVMNEENAGPNPANGVWSLQFVHDATGDSRIRAYRGIVSFRIPDTLPAGVNQIKITALDTDGETETEIINYTSGQNDEVELSLKELTEENDLK